MIPARTATLAAAGLAACLVVAPAEAGPPGCPPGLAKKNPPCIPPGQTKKLGYAPGDVLDRDAYVVLGDPWRYGLPRAHDYALVDGLVVRLDPDTRAILRIVGALAELLQ